MSKELRKVHPLRNLTEHEQKEEIWYRQMLREKWSFLPGEHPVDVYRREREAEE